MSDETSASDKRLLNEAEAAQSMALSVRTLQAWRVRGEGPNFVKLGRRVAYRPSDLQKYIDSQVFGSTTQRQHGGAR